MGEMFAGRYELIDPIASGGMGTVWRVLDHTDGQVLAAKVLRQADAAMLLRFVREQSVRIAHDHVVTPLSWAGVDDRVLFTMPLVRGGSVADLLRRHGGLPPRWIGMLLDQTLQALEAVHGAGIVHRDVKPGNLLLEPTGTGRPHLRLTDFGIAVPQDEPRLTRGPQAIGTPGYMAPEQYAGADPDPSADLYALGVVALEMLTGTRPSADGAQPPDLRPLRTGDRDRDAVLDLVGAATAYDPGQRPTATALRQHPALQHLVGLPADRAERIDIADAYPPPTQLTTPPTIPPPPPTLTATPPPPPPPPTPAAVTRVATRPETVVAGPASPRRTSALPGWVLLAAGLVALVVSGLLLL